MKRLLVVDDEKAVRYSFERAFGDEFEIITAENGLDGYEKAKIYRPDVILLDIKMPVLNGIDALKKIKELYPDIVVIMMTAFGDTNLAIETMKLGAYDYITKPFDNKELKTLIEKALATMEVDDDEDIFKVDKTALDSEVIVGKSKAILNVCKLIGQFADSDMPVLITGESGVGKELVAHAIHKHSSRKDKPFLAINCASLPENLVESELFGFEQGAFTGAVKKRIGLFEQCSGGTLFLDEIADMTLSAQSKALRVIQDSTFQRLGGQHAIRVDVRIIAAT
ncbi:MAG: sigma-54 dependent transcriptional regulator, partial [Thermodesulfovibrionales bacterium]|nr:sigma-54 dependent transcriptional regulator [Thermodesulfovibrionales bacterium]